MEEVVFVMVLGSLVVGSVVGIVTGGLFTSVGTYLGLCLAFLGGYFLDAREVVKG